MPMIKKKAINPTSNRPVKAKIDIPAVHRALARAFATVRAPVIDLVAAQTHDPFHVLVGTILSARTQDETTAAACRRLFQRVHTPAELRQVSLAELERLIFPVGFYHTKARHLRALPDVLAAKFGGRIPQTVEELCELPGVGRKTANLVVVLGFDLPGICVDVHVHRICNRLGLLRTGTPLETEMTLRQILPQRYWKTWNSYLVAFGQTQCRPVNPRCATCPLRRWCATGRQ
ncbi:MAG: endonuclease III domain-containing protein [Kiritimatiellia bacterium]